MNIFKQEFIGQYFIVEIPEIFKLPIIVEVVQSEYGNEIILECSLHNLHINSTYKVTVIKKYQGPFIKTSCSQCGINIFSDAELGYCSNCCQNILILDHYKIDESIYQFDSNIELDIILNCLKRINSCIWDKSNPDYKHLVNQGLVIVETSLYTDEGSISNYKILPLSKIKRNKEV